MRENAVMSSTPFSARGAVDLGALATARQNQQKAAQAMANAPAGVVIDVTTENFQAEVIDRSMQVPVVLDLWAEWCGPCKQLSPILEKLAADDGGRWVLAKVDVDAEQQIAAAFQVQSIPSVFAVIAGQPVPLFQGAYPESQIRQILDELLRVAAEQGVAGTLAAEAPEGASRRARGDRAAGRPEVRGGLRRDRGRGLGCRSGGLPGRAGGVSRRSRRRCRTGHGRAVRPHGRPSTSPLQDATGLEAADFAALRNDWPAAFALGIDVVRVTRATSARRPGHGCSSTSCSPATTRPCRRPARRWRAPSSSRLRRRLRADLVASADLRAVHRLVAALEGASRSMSFWPMRKVATPRLAVTRQACRLTSTDDAESGPSACARRSQGPLPVRSRAAR